MPTIVYTEGFEHRTVGSTAVNDFGGTGGVGIVDTITNATAFTSVAGGRNGYGMQVAPAGVNSIWSKSHPGTDPTVSVVSFYIKFTTLPVTDCRLFWFNTASAGDGRLWFNNSTTKFYVNFESTKVNGSDVGVALSTGVWYRVDLRVNVSATLLVIDCQIDGGTNVQVTYQDASTGTASAWEWGTDGGTPTYTAIVDEFVASATSGDYPIGAHKVLSVVPESDAASNYGTDIMEQGTGTDLSSSNQGWQYLDDWPPTNPSTANDADHVTQAAGDVSNSVVVNMQNTAETTIWGAVAVAAKKSDAASPSNSAFTETVYSDTFTTLLYSGDMSESTAHYRTAVLTTAKLDTLTEFNGLQMRVGAATDSAPDPEWLAVMIQYAVPEATYAPPLSRPSAIRHLIRR